MAALDWIKFAVNNRKLAITAWTLIVGLGSYTGYKEIKTYTAPKKPVVEKPVPEKQKPHTHKLQSHKHDLVKHTHPEQSMREHIQEFH